MMSPEPPIAPLRNAALIWQTFTKPQNSIYSNDTQNFTVWWTSLFSRKWDENFCLHWLKLGGWHLDGAFHIFEISRFVFPRLPNVLKSTRGEKTDVITIYFYSPFSSAACQLSECNSMLSKWKYWTAQGAQDKRTHLVCAVFRHVHTYKHTHTELVINAHFKDIPVGELNSVS